MTVEATTLSQRRKELDLWQHLFVLIWQYSGCLILAGSLPGAYGEYSNGGGNVVILKEQCRKNDHEYKKETKSQPPRKYVIMH
jgi:hypothetical protein